MAGARDAYAGDESRNRECAGDGHGRDAAPAAEPSLATLICEALVLVKAKRLGSGARGPPGVAHCKGGGGRQ